MKQPLVIPTLLYVGGILAGDYLSLPLPWLVAATAVPGILALLSARLAPWCLGFLLFGAGWTHQVATTTVLSPRDLRVQFHAPAIVTLRGRLVETPYQRMFERGEVESWRTIAQVEASAIAPQGTAWQPAFGTVAVTTPGILPERFFGGREVEVTGVLSPPKPPPVPGGFDYPKYLRRQGIYFQLRADSTNEWRLAAPPGPSDRPPLADRFGAAAQRILARGLPAVDEPLRLLWTMTLGWKTGLTAQVSEPFMRSGTMHIFAISGLHIALIAGVLVSVLRVLQVPRGVCGLVVVPLIWCYTGVTGWQASAIRSTVMMTIIIAGWSLRRPSDLLNSLAAAAFVILLWDPQQLFQASFQLSFFVVLALALFTGFFRRLTLGWLEPDPLLPAELRPRWQRWTLKPLQALAAGLATSLAAWIGSMPLIAYYFNFFTPVSLLANLVIVPLSGLALTSNVASLALGPLWPAIGELLNHSGWFWMWAMLRVSEWAAHLPGGCLNIAPPSALTFLLYYATVISVTAGWLARPRLRRWILPALALLAAAWLGLWFHARQVTTLTVVPLGGGSAIHCHDPGRSGDWLIDTGSASAAEFTLKPFLRSQGVNRLERLILSHGDARQLGGAEITAQLFPPRQILASPVRFRSPSYRKLAETYAKDARRWRTIQAGDRAGPWAVLHPAEADQFSLADDSAVVLRGEFGGTKILLLSDLGRSGQEALLNRKPDLHADIVVAGLPTAGEPLADGLLDAIQPVVIVVADSEYPATRRASPRLRERLARRGVPVVYTREAGAAQLVFRGRGCVLKTADGAILEVSKPAPGSGRVVRACQPERPVYIARHG